MTAVRLVVADRSATVRAVLQRVLGDTGAIEIVGETDDGHEAVELIREISPDGLVLDLDLVGLGGRELVEAVAAIRHLPIFVLTPATRSDSTRLAFAAHGLGVIGVHPKPETAEGWAELGNVLGESVLEICRTAGVARPLPAEPDDTPVIGRGLRYVAIGASTGGPGALCDVLCALGGDVNIGVVVVQHIAAGFEIILAEWLATESGLDIEVARHGERLLPGTVRLAPAGGHTVLGPDGVLRVDRLSPAVKGHSPSADTLFKSLLDHPPESVAAVQLSGMGSDGAEGMSRLMRADVLTLAQDEASCAVFGMPRAAMELGAVTVALPPVQIGRLLARASGRHQ